MNVSIKKSAPDSILMNGDHDDAIGLLGVDIILNLNWKAHISNFGSSNINWNMFTQSIEQHTFSFIEAK